MYRDIFYAITLIKKIQKICKITDLFCNYWLINPVVSPYNYVIHFFAKSFEINHHC